MIKKTCDWNQRLFGQVLLFVLMVVTKELTF